MEIALFLLLLVVTGLVAFVIWHLHSSGGRKEQLESVLNQRLTDFSEKIRQAMDTTRQEVERSKDAVSSGTIKTLEHLKEMQSVVGSLAKQQEKAQELGKSLEYLLQTPKLRGNYGETILEEMLEKVLPKGIWERQYAIDGQEKVDAVVKYKDVVVPIDSKFPRDDYQKYLSEKDPAERQKWWSEYEKALKVQINSIKDKYIKPEKGTTEFALMFIPSEAIYYETIAEKNHLGEPCQIYEYAAQRKVIPVSPNTFYAFLNVIILGIRNVEIAKEARKLQGILSKVEKDFDFFYNNFEDIGKALDKAARSYNTGRGQVQRFKKNLDAALKFELTHQKDGGPKALPED